METNKVNALSTATIAFVTILGLMIGFYYNLTTTDTKVLYILILEIIMIISVILFTMIINRWTKEDEKER